MYFSYQREKRRGIEEIREIDGLNKGSTYIPREIDSTERERETGSEGREK